MMWSFAWGFVLLGDVGSFDSSELSLVAGEGVVVIPTLPDMVLSGTLSERKPVLATSDRSSRRKQASFVFGSLPWNGCSAR